MCTRWWWRRSDVVADRQVAGGDVGDARPPSGASRPTTVAVGGLVDGDPPGQGADLGATARFERAERGRVASADAPSRTSVRSPVTDTAAAARLADEAFAVVPAVGIVAGGDDVRDRTPAVRGRRHCAEWFGNPWGFGITGAALVDAVEDGESRRGVCSSRALLGGSKGKKVGGRHRCRPAGRDPSRGDHRRAPQGGFRGRRLRSRCRRHRSTPRPPRDRSSPGSSRRRPPSCCSRPAPTPLAIAQQLAALGYTGTVGVGDALYAPSAPAIGAGLTALVPIAPIEADTPAIRRMTADVRAVDAAAVITPAVAEGYFAADLFLDVLRRVGRKLTAKRFVAVGERRGVHLRGCRHRRPFHLAGDAQHEAIPCGALVQGDGTRYFVAEPYRCDPPIRIKAR